MDLLVYRKATLFDSRLKYTGWVGSSLLGPVVVSSLQQAEFIQAGRRTSRVTRYSLQASHPSKYLPPLIVPIPRFKTSRPPKPQGKYNQHTLLLFTHSFTRLKNAFYKPLNTSKSILQFTIFENILNYVLECCVPITTTGYRFI